MNAVQQPLVSILCVTYNHEQYIERTIEGFLAQETSFPFEICIGEDESSDRTREICQRYADNHPELIRLFLRKREDVIYYDGKPTGRYNFLETIKASRGKYIALCEGDDYWTHSSKLQHQVDFLEKNPEYTLAAHAVQHLNKDGSIAKHVMPSDFYEGTGELLAEHGNYIPTLSAVFRKKTVVDKIHILNGLPCADYPMWLTCSEEGKVKYFPYIMGTYRNHGKGSWSSLSDEQVMKFNADLYGKLSKHFSDNINFTLRNKSCSFSMKLMQVAINNNDLEEAKQHYNNIMKVDPDYLFEILQYMFSN